MKRTKRVMAMLMVCLMLFGSVVPVQAAFKTRTKKAAAVISVTLRYDAYKDAAGRKLVRSGTITQVKADSPMLWGGTKSLSRLDGGRTYRVTLNGALTGNHGEYFPVKGAAVEFSYDS